MSKELLRFLDESPTAFGAVSSIVKILEKKGYKKLDSKEIVKGGKYYTTRNDSSIIAFNIGKKLKEPAMHVCASHTDCPSFKLKPNPIIKSPYGCKLNLEVYGGILTRAWFDRPLSIAGRVMVNSTKGIKPTTYIDEKPFCIMPSMAPHLGRTLEDSKANVAVDMVPIISLDDKFDFNEYLAKNLKIKKDDILGFDLYLYPLEKGYMWGQKNEFITSGHIDNLECAYTSLMGFIDNFNDNNINVYASFDNEEVGSLTRQGADSNFFEDLFTRICCDLELDYLDVLDRSILLSCDNAHGIHPNHVELYDKDNAPLLNKGVVIKYNAAQSYTTDSLSGALFMKLLKDNKLEYQVFANKTGTRGGGTLGNISTRHLSMMSVDIGLAQWAMHSPVETAGSKDVKTMIEACKCFYKAHLSVKDNTYKLD